MKKLYPTPSHPIPPYKNVARVPNDTRATLFLATMPSDYYSATLCFVQFEIAGNR